MVQNRHCAKCCMLMPSRRAHDPNSRTGMFQYNSSSAAIFSEKIPASEKVGEKELEESSHIYVRSSREENPRSSEPGRTLSLAVAERGRLCPEMKLLPHGGLAQLLEVQLRTNLIRLVAASNFLRPCSAQLCFNSPGDLICVHGPAFISP